MRPVKRLAKRLLIGTRWEGPARRAHWTLTRSKGSLYDAQTIDVMRRVLRPDSSAIDVGAFEGGMLSHIVRMAPRGRHFAFEPLPGRADALAARFPGVEVRAFAIGEAPGEAGYASVPRAPALSGLSARPDLEPGERVETIRVQVETLDRIVPADLPIAFVKVDVEGGELGVFRGAGQTLRRCRPVVVFESGLAAKAYGATAEEIHDELARAGLQVSTMGAWLARERALDRGGFVDAVESGRDFYFIAFPG